jgi:hypothetical protein
LKVHSWWCSFYGLGQMYNDMCHHYSIIQTGFTVLSIFRALSMQPSLSMADILLTPIVLTFPERHVVGIIQSVAFLIGFFHYNVNLSFLPAFHCLIIHFFSVLNNILLMYYFSHQLKDILVFFPSFGKHE